VDALKGLTALLDLDLYGCTSLTNVDGLSELRALRVLGLTPSHELRSLVALKDLTALESLLISGYGGDLDALKDLRALRRPTLAGCSGVTKLDALKGLKALQLVHVYRCLALSDVGALKELPELKAFDISPCEDLPGGAIDALQAALPSTHIRTSSGAPFWQGRRIQEN
jgi:hypothetical protein